MTEKPLTVSVEPSTIVPSRGLGKDLWICSGENHPSIKAPWFVKPSVASRFPFAAAAKSGEWCLLEIAPLSTSRPPLLILSPTAAFSVNLEISHGVSRRPRHGSEKESFFRMALEDCFENAMKSSLSHQSVPPILRD